MRNKPYTQKKPTAAGTAPISAQASTAALPALSPASAPLFMNSRFGLLSLGAPHAMAMAAAAPAKAPPSDKEEKQRAPEQSAAAAPSQDVEMGDANRSELVTNKILGLAVKVRNLMSRYNPDHPDPKHYDKFYDNFSDIIENEFLTSEYPAEEYVDSLRNLIKKQKRTTPENYGLYLIALAKAEQSWKNVLSKALEHSGLGNNRKFLDNIVKDYLNNNTQKEPTETKDAADKKQKVMKGTKRKRPKNEPEAAAANDESSDEDYTPHAKRARTSASKRAAAASSASDDDTETKETGGGGGGASAPQKSGINGKTARINSPTEFAQELREIQKRYDERTITDTQAKVDFTNLIDRTKILTKTKITGERLLGYKDAALLTNNLKWKAHNHEHSKEFHVLLYLLRLITKTRRNSSETPETIHKAIKNNFKDDKFQEFYEKIIKPVLDKKRPAKNQPQDSENLKQIENNIKVKNLTKSLKQIIDEKLSFYNKDKITKKLEKLINQDLLNPEYNLNELAASLQDLRHKLLQAEKNPEDPEHLAYSVLDWIISAFTSDTIIVSAKYNALNTDNNEAFIALVDETIWNIRKKRGLPEITYSSYPAASATAAAAASSASNDDTETKNTGGGGGGGGGASAAAAPMPMPMAAAAAMPSASASATYGNTGMHYAGSAPLLTQPYQPLYMAAAYGVRPFDRLALLSLPALPSTPSLPPASAPMPRYSAPTATLPYTMDIDLGGGGGAAPAPTMIAAGNAPSAFSSAASFLLTGPNPLVYAAAAASMPMEAPAAMPTSSASTTYGNTGMNYAGSAPLAQTYPPLPMAVAAGLPMPMALPGLANTPAYIPPATPAAALVPNLPTGGSNVPPAPQTDANAMLDVEDISAKPPQPAPEIPKIQPNPAPTNPFADLYSAPLSYAAMVSGPGERWL